MRWALALLAVLIALGVGFAAGVVVTAEDDARDARGRVLKAGPVDVLDLRVGDCVNGLEAGGESVAVRAVPCRSRHEGEVQARVQLPDGPWPGRKRAIALAERRCSENFFFAPSERSWRQDDRVVTCIARLSAGAQPDR